MKSFMIAVGLCAFILMVGPDARGQSQLAVRASFERETYILYEALPMILQIRNVSARPVVLRDSEDGKSWLEIQVFRGEAQMMRALMKPEIDDELVIAPGDTITRQINLTPLFELRQRGEFKAQVLIRSGEVKAISPVTKFLLVSGIEIWKRTVGVRGESELDDGYRTYSLVLRRGDDHEYLYVGVRDDEMGLVYGMVPMGRYVGLQEPVTRIDQAGNLHVLFRQGPRTVGYAMTDIYARLARREVYSNLGTQPVLAVGPDGSISVMGGEKIYPREERQLTDQELNPPPPPLVKPKK